MRLTVAQLARLEAERERLAKVKLDAERKKFFNLVHKVKK